MPNILQPSSVSYEQIRQDLLDYVQSKPDYDAWKDFFEGGAGVTNIELQAGLGAFLSFHAYMSRRESHLFYAKLRSTIYGIADILGYPINRMEAGKLKLKITCDSSFFWDRDVPIGNLNGVPLSLLNSTHFNIGLNDGTGDGIDVVFGEWQSYSTTISGDIDFNEVELLLEDVDRADNVNFEVRVNDILTDTTKYVEAMGPTNILQKTLSDRILIVFGDDFFGLKAHNNDDIDIDYVYVHDVTDYSISKIRLDLDGEITDGVSVNPLLVADSTRKVTIVAPGYFSSKRRMVTNSDHEYIVLSYTGIVSAKMKRYDEEEDPCCTALISYLFSDEHLMSPSEEDQILDYLEDFKITGEQVVFVDPQAVLVNMEMTIVVDEGADTDEIETLATEAVNSQCLQLGSIFKVGTVVDEVSEINGVNRTYLTQPRYDKENPYNKYFKLDVIDITFTTDSNSVLEYGDGSGGYTG